MLRMPAYFQVHRIYRSSGASFAKAQHEFATRAVNNEHVQNAAISAARNSMAQAAAGGSGPNGRF